MGRANCGPRLEFSLDQGVKLEMIIENCLLSAVELIEGKRSLLMFLKWLMLRNDERNTDDYSLIYRILP